MKMATLVFLQKGWVIIMSKVNIAIYQMPLNDNRKFRSFDECKVKVEINDYVRVYVGTIDVPSDKALLDYVFEQFNINKPSDYHAHSLSVSDVIYYVDEKRYFYVDDIGFTEVWGD